MLHVCPILSAYVSNQICQMIQKNAMSFIEPQRTLP
jgi:hypothetical protein